MAFEEQNIGITTDLAGHLEAHAGWQEILLQATQDALMAHDESGRIFFWSQGATALYGWTEEEALGQSFQTLLDTQAPRPFVEIMQELAETGRWEGELEQKRRDGTPLVVASRWSFLEKSQIAPKTILQVNHDVTDLKRTLQHLNFLTQAGKLLVASFDYKEILVQVAERAVPLVADWCRVDLLREDGTLETLAIRHVDPEKVAWAYQLSELTPFDPDAPSGVAAVIRNRESEFFSDIPDSLLVAAAKDEQELSLIRSIGLSSAITVPLVVRNQGKGAITFVTTETKRHYTKTDLAMAEELASRVSLVMENALIYQELQDFNANLERTVVERTAALTETTETLRQLNAELQRSNQELQDFAYVASHDLQEPLRKIQAFGNLLEEEYSSVLGEGKMYIERMRNAASRMQVLINDLLVFSRVTSKALPFSEVNLTITAQEVVSDLEARLQATRGRVEIDELPTIEADPLQMRQLLQNLIGNALKFHRPDCPPIIHISGEVRVDPATAIEQCLLSVTDNGIGFDEKYLDRIFIVFQRLHGRGEYEGTGIGLAVVRKIVERHGGTITAHSTVGEGTTFEVTLPVQQRTTEGIQV